MYNSHRGIQTKHPKHFRLEIRIFTVCHRPSSRKYTAFQCQGQQYQYKRLAYGLKISSGHFNYLVAQMLQSDDVLSASVINYVDDLLIFTEDVQSHQGHAQAIYGLEGLR